MINLLPPETRQSYSYARRNKILLRWVIATAACLVVACLLVAGGYIYLMQTSNDTKQQIAQTNTKLQQQHIDRIEKQVNTISNNLGLAVQVLSHEILFSKLLAQLGTATPKDAILTNLTITQAQAGVQITAQTTSYDAATQLQANLADPTNKLFAKADLISINCGTNTTNTRYPCTANIQALFAPNNPFLFINDGAKQ